MSDTVCAGQWLRHLTNAPERPWRYLEEITPDPLGNPEMVVLKFSNGDGDRLHRDHLAIVNTVMFSQPRTMWEVSDSEPEADIATERIDPGWLCEGHLVDLRERFLGTSSWVEAILHGYCGRQVTEIPAAALEALRDELVGGAAVEVVAPPLSNGAPGIVEVRAGGREWKDADGVPVSRGFLDAYRIVETADRENLLIVPFVFPDEEPLR